MSLKRENLRLEELNRALAGRMQADRVAKHLETALETCPHCGCSDLAEPAYRELIEQLRLAMVVHADETGWRIGTMNAWLWVFTNRETTVYLIRSGKGARGHEAVIQRLGEIFEGVLVSDCFSAYDKDRLDEWLKQKCFAHLLKDLTAMKETARAAAAAFITETTGCLKDAVDLKKSRENADPEQDANVFTLSNGLTASSAITPI